MKRTALTLLVLTVCCTYAAGQTSRSIAVWSSGIPRYFNLNATDSLIYGDDESLSVFAEDTEESFESKSIDSITVVSPVVENTNTKSDADLLQAFSSLSISTSSAYKKVGNGNPLMGHKFGADPFAMVDGDRVYIYMTDDHMYDGNGNPIKSGYSDIRNISIISSEDLVNWTDHGAQQIAGSGGPASWANNSWAPSAAHKTIDGKEKYFLYFADNGSGIGVVTSDSPYGPWKQPSGMKQLISRSTPNCGNVEWLFDPAVLVDDDGKAYLYFGGGVPSGKEADPGTARCVQLGDDMVSIVGTPQTINPPYLFEDSGINKVAGKYLYSYCSNWTGNSNPGVAKIAYMTSDKPLGPFKYVGAIFDNPGDAGWAGGGGNNHHAVFEFKGKYYITYHTRALKKAMLDANPNLKNDFNESELRSACISEITVDTQKGTISKLNASQTSATGVAQLKDFDPYRTVPGATMAWEYGITTQYEKLSPVKKVHTAHGKAGSWLCLSNVDFKNGPVGLTVKAKGNGVIRVSNGTLLKSNKTFALVEVQDADKFQTYTVPVTDMPLGVRKKLYFIFSGDISIESWSFF